MVEQHFGSELVAIEVEIGFMETRVKQKMKREMQPKRTSLFSPIFFVKVVARQNKGKMIVDGVNIASMNCLDQTQSTIHLRLAPSLTYFITSLMGEKFAKNDMLWLVVS